MGIEEKIELEKLKQYWQERNVIRIEAESEIRELFRKKLSEYLEKAKIEFEDFLKGRLTITKNKYMITATLNDFKIQITFHEPNPSYKYEFALAIIDSIRREFSIVIHTQEKIYYPSLKIMRTEPKSIVAIKDDIKKIDEEILWMEDSKKRISSLQYCFSFYDINRSKPDYKKLIMSKDFQSVIEELLK